MAKRPPTFDEAEPAPSVAETEAQMRALLASGDIPQPDEVREGPEADEVSFVWYEQKLLVIVDRSKR